ncbi:MAG TPA: DUF1080 domain-containing protein [Gammaproteobacteria bacterium]|nr:DUF1080 domain-containing protein [Gammaproteobacteria bacterium]
MLPLAAQSQPPPGFADDVLGRWDITVTDADTQYPSWLEVRLRTESQLMGRFVGRFGSVRHLAEISFADGMLRFTAPLQYERGNRPLEFAATHSADRLTGTLIDPDGRTLAWVGTRAPPLERRNEGSPASTLELFNGHDLSGWHARFGTAETCWKVVDGALVSTPPCVDIVTERTFEDFVLDLEFSIPRGSNSGVYLRGRYEVQIQDTAGQALDALRMGSVYGFITPIADAAGAPESWQSMNIRLLGREITVVLNGETIIDAESIPGITGGALDSREGAPGPIMIQGDHGAIRFRKIALTPLSDTNE